MERFVLPYSGTLLVAHLAAYGLCFALDSAGIDVFLGHDLDSQAFEPVVLADADRDAVCAAVCSSAEQVESIVEHDLERGKAGNERRSTIWARASLSRDSERLANTVRLRAPLVADADGDPSGIAAGLLAGIGSPLIWGPPRLKASAGATALDGAIGNHTSDFVRGVLRPMRRAAAVADCDPASTPSADTPLDKTGWAPSGTRVCEVHQWLAALGLALLPVAHRQTERSQTPACWRKGLKSGVTLPVLKAPSSVPRLRAMLGLRVLTQITLPEDLERPPGANAAGILRGYDIQEVVVFERRDRASAGSSVAFDFRPGRLIDLVQPARTMA